jgi:hypothetical protein
VVAEDPGKDVRIPVRRIRILATYKNDQAAARKDLRCQGLRRPIPFCIFPTTMSGPCQVKTTMMLQWQAAARAYSQAVSALATKVVGSSPEQYQLLKEKTEKARNLTIEKRTAFERHMEEHGC